MKKIYSQSGQSLISFIIFTVTAIIIISGAVAVIVINSRATTTLYQGNVAYDVAEAGAENAIIRLLRDSDYPGETLSIGSDTATVTVNLNGGYYFITSKGVSGDFTRTIQAVASYNNNILTLISWKEL